MMRTLAMTLVLAGCGAGDDDGPSPDLLDTGWWTDTASLDAESCPHKLQLTIPEPGAANWYWLDAPTIYVATDKHERYDIWMQDAAGVRVDATLVWSDDGLSAELQVPTGLKANTDYQLSITDCGARHIVEFRTSSFGAPLQGSLEDLEGKTWQLDLVNATWVEPVGIAGLLQLYFTTPVLFGVALVHGDQIDFLAAPGAVDIFGVMAQDLKEPSWDFPITDFATQPYFAADSEEVVFAFEDTEVPVAGFRFTGTIGADYAKIGGGDLSGLGDTRNLGSYVNQPDDPNAICAYAESLGASCVPCPDGLPYCLFMHAVGVDGTLVPGLTLQPKD